MNEMEIKSNKSIIILLVIFIIISLGLTSYIVYDKFIDEKEDNKKNVSETISKEDSEKNLESDSVENNQSQNNDLIKVEDLKGYYTGDKYINVGSNSRVLATVQMGLFDNNKTIVSVLLPEADMSSYIGNYSVSNNGTISFTFDKIKWNSGDITELSPVKSISITKADVSYIYNLGDDFDFTNEKIYLNKTSDDTIKTKLNNLYSEILNN